LLRHDRHQLSGGGRLEETFASHNLSTVCDGVFLFSNNYHQLSGVLVMIAPAFFWGAFRRDLCLSQSVNCTVLSEIGFPLSVVEIKFAPHCK
jgi:hypothetical protein